MKCCGGRGGTAAAIGDADTFGRGSQDGLLGSDMVHFFEVVFVCS